MTYRSLSLVPPFGSNLISERFTQMDNLFSRLTGEKPVSETPAYNLSKKEDYYELEVSVPGYSQEDLDVSVLNNQLSISNRKKTEEENNNILEEEKTKWIHKGIRKNQFSLSFSLDYKISIKNATLNKGILNIKFKYEIPEQEKPKKIKISEKIRNENNQEINENCS